MIEPIPQSQYSLHTVQSWLEEYRRQLQPSPLEDIRKLSAQVDLTHAHPSGIAQLFASGHAQLDALFRDVAALRTAGRRLERVLNDQQAKSQSSGLAELSLVVGIATWKENAVPVLLYPVAVTRGKREVDGAMAFTGHVRLNPVLRALAAEHQIVLDEKALFDGSQYESGVPETSAVFAAITRQCAQVFPDFDIERHIVLGCLIDPASQILLENQRVIKALYAEQELSVALKALAGSEPDQQILQAQQLPEYDGIDGDPHREVQIGDVDNSVRYAARMVAMGHSLVMDTPLGADTALMAASVASQCMHEHRSVLYVAGVAEQQSFFMRAMKQHHLASSVLDLMQKRLNEDIDEQLIAAVNYKPQQSTANFKQYADELTGIRARLNDYFRDIHALDEHWGVSAYQVMQRLAQLGAATSQPASRVRLSASVAHALQGHLDEWSEKLHQLADLGAFQATPEAMPWYGAAVYSEQDAIHAYQRVVDVLQQDLPAAREHVTNVVKSCGFSVPRTAQEWAQQVTVLKNLRRVLDVFQPEIFERDVASMVQATQSKEQRAASGNTMGFWQRHRFTKEAKSLLRVGARVLNLHDALVIVQKQAKQWQLFAPLGSWPVLPSKLDALIAAQEQLADHVTALDAVLATTPEGAQLETLDLAVLEQRLKRLYQDHKSLDTLPARNVLEREFRDAGLGEVLDDFTQRHVEKDNLHTELSLIWYATIFDQLLQHSTALRSEDTADVTATTKRFAQVDQRHVASIGAMIHQEHMQELYDVLFAHTQEANQLHTMLASGADASIQQLQSDYPAIIAAAKPVLAATPAALAAQTQPVALADIVIIDAAAHMPSLQLLSLLTRARQVVILAHQETVSAQSVRMLAQLLPHVRIAAQPTCHAPRLAAFLQSHGYGKITDTIATPSAQGVMRYHAVAGSGIPVLASGLVESSAQEVSAIIELIQQRAQQFQHVPSWYLLSIITLTGAMRLRLGAELKTLASRNQQLAAFLRHVRILDIQDVAAAHGTDVILALSYAKTAHGKLLQQFGSLEGAQGQNLLLDALAVTRHNLDIVSAFSSQDLDDARLHQSGPLLLKALLQYAEHLGTRQERPLGVTQEASRNVLLEDLAQRLRSRELSVALQYGFEHDRHIPLVVGAAAQQPSVAVITDDDALMSEPSLRWRHRLLPEYEQSLGWRVAPVWSMQVFTNPEREADAIGALFQPRAEGLRQETSQRHETRRQETQHQETQRQQGQQS